MLSALAAVYVIRFNGHQSRKRATIDLILHQKADEALMADTRVVWALLNTNTSLAALAQDVESEKSSAILRVLNSHEFVALGIRKKAFDEKIYKMSQYSNVMKVWKAVEGFVCEIRAAEDKDTLFQEIEWLARRWKKKPIKQL